MLDAIGGNWATAARKGFRDSFDFQNARQNIRGWVEHHAKPYGNNAIKQLLARGDLEQSIAATQDLMVDRWSKADAAEVAHVQKQEAFMAPVRQTLNGLRDLVRRANGTRLYDDVMVFAKKAEDHVASVVEAARSGTGLPDLKKLNAAMESFSEQLRALEAPVALPRLRGVAPPGLQDPGAYRDPERLSEAFSEIAPYVPVAERMPQLGPIGAQYRPFFAPHEVVHDDPMVAGLVDAFQRRVHVRSKPVPRGELGFRIQHQHMSRHAGVSLVHMGHSGDKKHFMHDIEGDANMGRKAVMDKRRGPFKSEKGPSRVMARSAHTLIRKRHMQLEITVNRNVGTHELDVLIGKLEIHRTSVSGTIVYIVHRGVRRNMGTLDVIDLEKLRKEILMLLGRSKQVGILLVDNHGGGAMHHPNAHTAKYARSYSRENDHYSY